MIYDIYLSLNIYNIYILVRFVDYQVDFIGSLIKSCEVHYRSMTVV